MQEPANIPDPTQNLARKVKSHRFALLVQISLLFGVLVALNYLSCLRHERFDLSKSSRFTLSEKTVGFISSQQFAERDNPVEIICAFRRSTPNYSRIRAVLEEYELRSPNIRVIFTDPLRNPSYAQQLSNKYNIVFDQNKIIIDARPDPSQDPSSLTPGATESPSSAKIRFINEESMVVFEDNPQGQPQAVGLRTEDAITAALVSATEGTPRRIYLVADKSNLGATGGKDAPYWRLFNALRLQNIALAPLRLAEVSTIPEDAEAVIFIGPQYDFADDEIKILEDYWSRPKAGLLVLLDPTARPRKLHRFLRENGINPRQDRIVRGRRNGPINFDVTAIFSSGIPFTKGFWGNSTIFEGQSQSLEVFEDESRLRLRQISPTPLLEAARGYYGETRFNEASPTYDPKEDQGENVYLAAAVERGRAADNLAERTSSRLVAIGNTEFLLPENLRSEQLDFVTASLNWMLDREELAGISSRENLLYKVSIDNPTQSAINGLLIGLLPTISLLIGLVVWNIRRR